MIAETGDNPPSAGDRPALMRLKMVRTMGNYQSTATRAKRPKRCKGCGRPVSQTVGNCGYCKKCIAKARELNGNGKA